MCLKNNISCKCCFDYINKNNYELMMNKDQFISECKYKCCNSQEVQTIKGDKNE